MKRVPLRDREGNVRAYTLIDDEDFELVMQRAWRLDKDGYVVGHTSRSSSHRLHRLLMGDPPGLEVDHENGEPLDNRRSNLRLATTAQNRQNLRRPWAKTGHRGVYAKRGRFYAQVKIGRARHNLGTFDTAEEAAAVAEAFRAQHMPYSKEAADAVT